MPHTPHELAADFPDQAERIAQLRQTDAHFAKLADAYHAKNHDVHLAESDVKPTSDDYLSTLRKERMALKDQIFRYLSK